MDDVGCIVRCNRPINGTASSRTRCGVSCVPGDWDQASVSYPGLHSSKKLYLLCLKIVRQVTCL